VVQVELLVADWASQGIQKEDGVAECATMVGVATSMLRDAPLCKKILFNLHLLFSFTFSVFQFPFSFSRLPFLYVLCACCVCCVVFVFCVGALGDPGWSLQC
jgi:hypothetical protein